MNTKTRSIVLSLALMAAIITLNGCGGGGGGSAAPPPSNPPLPAAPTTVYAVAGNLTVTVHWTAMAFATSYSVLRSDTSPTTGYTVTASGVGSTVYTDATVTNNQTYYYVVQSQGSSGASANSSPAAATPQAASGTVISGTVNYEDKTYDIFGFTGATPLKAVRYATVELVDLSNPLTPLAATVTSPSGTFSFNAAAFAGKNVYVSVEADATSPAGEVVVKNLSNAPYTVKSATIPVTTGTAADLGITIPVTNTAAGAFNIIDVYTSGAQFVSALSSTTVQTLSVYWPSYPNSAGTYYCSPADPIDPTDCVHGEGIYVLSDAYNAAGYDTDEYDDDVLWHEYGHFTAYHFSKDDSPGGAHAFWINDYDMRLAWSEGWGDFFQTAVKVWLANTNPALLSVDPGATPLSQYVDTATIPRGKYISLNIGDPEVGPAPTDVCTGDQCKYSTNEIAVANVLWAVMAGNGINGNYGMKPVWDAVTSPAFAATTPRVNLEGFFDSLTSANTSSTSDVQTVFASRLIDYSPDAFEPDGDILTTTNTYATLPQPHTLYSGVSVTDEDFIVFSGTPGSSHTVSISNLLNGAAPFVQILQSDGTTEIAHSDPSPLLICNPVTGDCTMNGTSVCDFTGCHVNSSTTLVSSVPFTAPSGSVYVRVKPSDNRPATAGRYGNYTLTITP